MSFFASFFGNRGSAPVARDRLQILLAHERVGAGQSDLIAKLQREIIAVIERHVAVDQDKVQIKLDRSSGCSMLEIDIEMPQGQELRLSSKPAVGAKADVVKPGAPKAKTGTR